MPVAYAVGSHPADFLAAMVAMPSVDELDVVGAMRGAPVPVVKCVTNDIYVPADAEYVIEGYLDPAGHVEPEGPFGEYVGYYGVVKRNPVLHITAITHREDALFQTLTISGRTLTHTDTTQLSAMKTESAAWAALMAAVREPLAVYATSSSGGMYNVRVSLRQRVPGEPQRHRGGVRLACRSEARVRLRSGHRRVLRRRDRLGVRHALPGRPRSRHRLGLPLVPLDPSLGGARTGAKLGFDCTMPFGKSERIRVLGAEAAGRQESSAAEIGRGGAGRGAGELSGADGGARQQGRPRNRARA